MNYSSIENMNFYNFSEEVYPGSNEPFPDERCLNDGSKSLHLTVLEVLICVIGLAFNGVALFVIVRLKDYKKIISHLYVLHLAIADILLLFYLPFQAHQHFRGSWKFGEWFCRFNQGIFVISYYAGIFFLTVMSFDRYIAICHPVSARWRKIRTHENAILTCIVVWVLSIVLSLPMWMWSKVSCSCGYGYEYLDDSFPPDFNETEYLEYKDIFYSSANVAITDNFNEHNISDGKSLWSACRQKEGSQFHVWIPINFALTFVFPITLMGICYSLILWRVLHPAVSAANSSTGRRRILSDSSNRKDSSGKFSFRSNASSTSSSGSDRLSRKQKVTLVVVSLVACFLICWSPFHIYNLAKLVGLPPSYSPDDCYLLGDITHLLAYSNSMLNPVFYTFLGSDFRRRLRTAFQIYRRRRRFSTFSKGARTARSSVPTHGRSFGSGAHHKTMEGHTNYPMQSIHSMVSNHFNNDFNERSQMLSTKNKEFLSKSDVETLQISDVSNARLSR